MGRERGRHGEKMYIRDGEIGRERTIIKHSAM
jgi:hypothetical protein